MTPRAYYNEVDRRAAAWLRALITAGVIADGEVDDRSITDVRAADLRGFTQCHFFAGIGGWSYALRLAGWPDARPVWTGSCPCQPFSSAGAQAGFADARDLWPAWARLIRQCRPDVIAGEQVASAVRHGWLDRLYADLERLGYAVGAVDLPAACVGAFHLRQRLWFVADAGRERCEGQRLRVRPEEGGRHAAGVPEATGRGAVGFWDAVDWLPCADGKARPTEPGLQPLAHGVPARVGRLRGYGNAIVPQVAAEVIRAYLEARG